MINDISDYSGRLGDSHFLKKAISTTWKYNNFPSSQWPPFKAFHFDVRTPTICDLWFNRVIRFMPKVSIQHYLKLYFKAIQTTLKLAGESWKLEVLLNHYISVPQFFKGVFMQVWCNFYLPDFLNFCFEFGVWRKRWGCLQLKLDVFKILLNISNILLELLPSSSKINLTLYSNGEIN